MSDAAGEPATRTTSDFERYGLVAALTLVVLSLLLADRLRPSQHRVSVPPADRLLRVRIGGNIPRPAPSAAGPVRPDVRGTAPAVRAARQPGPAQPPSPPPPAPSPRAVVVQAGETLGEIAKRELGSARRAVEIATLNGVDPARIREGQTLRIPAR